jgi:hypothetical protein
MSGKEPDVLPDGTAFRCICGRKLTQKFENANKMCRQCSVDRTLNPVTRFEVIDYRGPNGDAPRGRVFVVRDIKVELSYQDDGRTLKAFITDRK